MKIATALFAAANYAALAPLPAAAECGVSNFKIKDDKNNDERILRKHDNKKNDVDKEETEGDINLPFSAPGNHPHPSIHVEKASSLVLPVSKLWSSYQIFLNP